MSPGPSQRCFQKSGRSRRQQTPRPASWLTWRSSLRGLPRAGTALGEEAPAALVRQVTSGRILASPALSTWQSSFSEWPGGLP